MEPLLALTGIIGLILTLRLLAGAFDGDRIQQYAKSQGWTLRERHWDPFGPGWFGTKGSRIYKVRYADAHGDEHEAYLKTSMLSGVYITEDRVIRRDPAAALRDAPSAGLTSHAVDLQEENRRLRQRIQELEQSQPPS